MYNADYYCNTHCDNINYTYNARTNFYIKLYHTIVYDIITPPLEVQYDYCP